MVIFINLTIKISLDNFIDKDLLPLSHQCSSSKISIFINLFEQ